MIAGRVSLGPRNTYLSVAGRGFNSNVGDDSKDGTIGVLPNMGNGSYLIVHGGVVLSCGVSNKVLTLKGFNTMAEAWISKQLL